MTVNRICYRAKGVRHRHPSSVSPIVRDVSRLPDTPARLSAIHIARPATKASRERSPPSRTPNTKPGAPGRVKGIVPLHQCFWASLRSHLHLHPHHRFTNPHRVPALRQAPGCCGHHGAPAGGVQQRVRQQAPQRRFQQPAGRIGHLNTQRPAARREGTHSKVTRGPEGTAREREEDVRQEDAGPRWQDAWRT